MQPLLSAWRRFRAWSIDPKTDRVWLRVGVGAWIALILAVAIFALAKPGKRSVSTVYWTASQQWRASEDMYGSKKLEHEGYHGFLYFPQAAVLSTPFSYLPLGMAEALWRVVNLGVLAWAFWRVAKVVAKQWRAREVAQPLPLPPPGGEGRGGVGLWFGLSSVLAIPTLTGSAQNGQFNIIILALMTHAAVDVIRGRSWRAAACLALAIALKPHAIVFALLLSALYPAMIPRLGVCAVGVVALGFLHPDPAYAWSQHQSFLDKMKVASRPPPGTNQDLVGLLHTLGIELSLRAWWVVRGVAAIVTLALCFWAKRVFGESGTQRPFAGRKEEGIQAPGIQASSAKPLEVVISTLTLALLYIIIFNPRTEGPTYAILGVPVGLYSARELIVRPGMLAWALVAVCLLLGFSHEIVGKANPWARPALAIVFAIYIVALIVRGRRSFAVPT